MINDFIEFLETFHTRFPSPSDKIKTTWFSLKEHSNVIKEIEINRSDISAEIIIFAVTFPNNFTSPHCGLNLFLTENFFYWGKQGKEKRILLSELRSVHFSVGMTTITVNGQDYNISKIEHYSGFDRQVCDWLGILFQEIIRFLHRHTVHIDNQTVESYNEEYSFIISRYLKNNPPPPSLYKNPSKEKAATDILGTYMPPPSEIILLYVEGKALWLLTASNVYIHNKLIVPLIELVSFEEKIGWSENQYFEKYLRINGMSSKNNANIPIRLLGSSRDQVTLKYIVNLTQYIIQNHPNQSSQQKDKPGDKTSPVVLEQTLIAPSPAPKTLQDGSKKIKDQQTVGNALLRWLGFIIYGPILMIILFIGLGWCPSNFQSVVFLFFVGVGIILATGIFFAHPLFLLE